MFGWPSGLRQQAVNLPREMSTSIGSNPIPNARKLTQAFNFLAFFVIFIIKNNLLWIKQ